MAKKQMRAVMMTTARLEVQWRRSNSGLRVKRNTATRTDVTRLPKPKMYSIALTGKERARVCTWLGRVCVRELRSDLGGHTESDEAASRV